MPIKDRAAQFAPFAALSGHREALAEEIKNTMKTSAINKES